MIDFDDGTQEFIVIDHTQVAVKAWAGNAKAATLRTAKHAARTYNIKNHPRSGPRIHGGISISLHAERTSSTLRNTAVLDIEGAPVVRYDYHGNSRLN